MSRTKILYVHHGKGLGGAPLSLLYLIEGLDQTRFEPVVAFLHDSDALSLYRQRGIAVVGPLDVRDFSHTAVYWLRWRHAPQIIRCLWDCIRTIFAIAPAVYNQIKPDIVHLNTSSLLGWGIAAKLRGLPIMWHIREPLAAGYFGLRRWITKKIIDWCATRIIPICHADGQPWHASPKLQVVYNAVNPAQFSSTNSATNHPPTVLFLGGLGKEKGTRFLLEAFRAVLEKVPHAQLWIAGYFPAPPLHLSWWRRRFAPGQRYAAACRELVTELGPAVKLLGLTTEVPRLLQEADLLVFPAAVDHFARPVIEAGFMGKPAVASNFEHLRELIVDHETGCLVDYGDHESWASTIVGLLKNPSLRAQLGNAAQEYCQANFNLSHQVKTIERLYTSTPTHGSNLPPLGEN